MPSTPDAPRSLVVRVLLALGALAVAALFGFVGVAIAFAPYDGSPALVAWPLRGFGVFLFGGIAAGALGFAYGLLRPAREPPLPAAVLARCPFCGEPWAASDLCAWCAVPRAESAGAWRPVLRPTSGPSLLMGAMGGAMVCLGVFLASISTDGAIALIVVYGLLVLLLLLVGGVMLWGAALVLGEQWRTRGKRDYAFFLQRGSSFANATAHLERGALSLEGRTLRWLDIDEAPGPEPAPSPREPALGALIKMMAVLHARGELALTHNETITWRFDGALRRRSTIDVSVHLAGFGGGDEDEGIMPSDPVLASLVATSIRHLEQQLTDSVDLQSAFEHHAAALPSDEVDEHTKAVLTWVLRERSPAGAPYRERG